MKITRPIIIFLFVTVNLQAQIIFEPEFGVYKLDASDQLKSLNLFESDTSGNEYIFAGYMNQKDHNIRLVKYSFTGAVLEHRAFQLGGIEQFISGNLFRQNNINYFVSANTFTKDSLKEFDSTWMDYRTISVNYLSIKLFNFESQELLDSAMFLTGINSELGYNKDTTKLQKINFISIPHPGSDLTNIYIGIGIVKDNQHGAGSFWGSSSIILKFSFTNSKISSVTKIQNCGNDFFFREGTIISSGYFKDGIAAGGRTETTNQYILKSTNEFTTGYEALYSVGGNQDMGKNHLTYRKYFSYFNGLFNNYPEDSEYGPMFWYSGFDTYDPSWDGPYFFLYTKDLSQIKYSIYGGFFPNTIHSTHTYLRLNDSSYALFYFTKDGPIITYWLRRLSDGKLIYSDSYGTLLPSYILKTKDGKQYFFQPETSGLTAYVIKGDLISTAITEDADYTPAAFELKQNYPNPFNASTKISYSIPNLSRIQLRIYDMLGNEISTLVDQIQTAGEHYTEFNASSLTSGVYIYTIQAGNFRDSKKLILLK